MENSDNKEKDGSEIYLSVNEIIEAFVRFTSGSKSFAGVTLTGFYDLSIGDFIDSFATYLQSGMNFLDHFAVYFELRIIWQNLKDGKLSANDPVVCYEIKKALETKYWRAFLDFRAEPEMLEDLTNYYKKGEAKK